MRQTFSSCVRLLSDELSLAVILALSKADFNYHETQVVTPFRGQLTGSVENPAGVPGTNTGLAGPRAIAAMLAAQPIVRRLKSRGHTEPPVG
jgi:hypothetical protein